MRRYLAILLLGLAVVPFAWTGLAPAKSTAPQSRQVGCGIERWSVKTLADPAGRLLSLQPRAATVRGLRRKAGAGVSEPEADPRRRAHDLSRAGVTRRDEARGRQRHPPRDRGSSERRPDHDRRVSCRHLHWPCHAEGEDEDATSQERLRRSVRFADALVQETERHGDDHGRWPSSTRSTARPASRRTASSCIRSSASAGRRATGRPLRHRRRPQALRRRAAAARLRIRTSASSLRRPTSTARTSRAPTSACAGTSRIPIRTTSTVTATASAARADR